LLTGNINQSSLLGGNVDEVEGVDELLMLLNINSCKQQSSKKEEVSKLSC